LTGYTYEYLSPDNFALPEAFVENGLFAPNRQAFKAIVVRNNDILTTFGVTKLAEYADAGLPIIFLGGVPSTFIDNNATGSANANATITRIASLNNVHTTSAGAGLAQTLESLQITPRTSVTANGTWYTYWREDSTTSTDYVYVYNDAASLPLGQGFSTGNITFENIGVPYTYDAWTGDITPILNYQQTATQTTIPLQLAGNQDITIAFVSTGSQSLHVASSSASPLSIRSATSSLSIISSYNAGSTSYDLSNGSTVTFPPVLTPSITLSNWDLTVESWTSPSNPFDLNPDASRTNSTYTGIASLIPWQAISASLATVSGRGYYFTSFQWPPTTASPLDPKYTVSGAFINLGAIVHTARVTINGQALAPLDVTSATADISPYLIVGTNQVEVVVSTPLGNALRPIWNVIETAGVPASSFSGTTLNVEDYGLVFPVSIVPYREDIVGF
jgi:hypothetical protein